MKNNFFLCITTCHYQIISILLLFNGLCGILFSENLIKILISLEFIINAINILFISFSSYKSDISYLGYTVVLFTTGISAIVMAIGIYIIYQINKYFGTIDLHKIYKKYKDNIEC